MTSYDKFKNYSFCFGGRHYTMAFNNKPDTNLNKKCKKGIKLLRGDCS